MPTFRRLRAPVVAAVLVAVGIVLAGCAPPPPPATLRPPVLDAACRGVLAASTPGSVASAAIDELSGLSASRRTDGVWWGHNDSGDSARVFAIGNDGRDLGAYTLSGATAVDWEDIAVGPGPLAGATYLYAGDIGDNPPVRANVVVYRVQEPAVNAAATVPPAPQVLSGVSALRLVYPNGARDAEALIVDPVSGELFVVTKELSGASVVYRAPANLAAGSTTTLTQVATLSLGFGSMVTAADVTPAGDVVGLRTYGGVLLYQRPAGAALAQAFSQPSCNGATASEAQGESLGFTRDGRGYVTASEGLHPALHRFVAP
jgi:hypothetical protein